MKENLENNLNEQYEQFETMDVEDKIIKKK
jgi:hypothetical protein